MFPLKILLILNCKFWADRKTATA